MKSFWQNFFVFTRSSPAIFSSLLRAGWLKNSAGLPPSKHNIAPNFFGICAASNEDPSTDDYIVAKLHDLGLKSVRIDFSYHSRGQYGERFLRRLIAEKFDICLHLVQPYSEAQRMTESKDAAENWRIFTTETLTAYGSDIKLVEVGSTVNRQKWAGYSIPGFIVAWKNAHEVAAAKNCRLAGPNVTDFEPFFNIVLLNEMKRNNILPAVHTDNLFVERATEPELFDHKIAGHFLSDFLRFNLIKKGQILKEIAQSFGVCSTLCPHVSWSLRRIARLHENKEEKQADYLARYCCLAAASGAFEQVYWGPLIGQREGLIDDGTAEFPETPHVTFYGKARGNIKNYRLRPAYNTMRTVSRFLADTTYLGKINKDIDLEIHAFASASGLQNVAWTTNGKRVLVRELFPSEALKDAIFYSRDGLMLDNQPAMISESPIYIKWPVKSEGNEGKIFLISPNIPAKQAFLPSRRNSLRGIRFAPGNETKYDYIERGMQAGICLVGIEESVLNAIVRPANDILRDARNKVWRVPLPGLNVKAVIKCFRPPGCIRRILQRKKGDKALRSWNGAQELLRRGIATPLPLAFFHNPASPLASESWYICEEFAGGFSIRDAFTAFSSGAHEFAGLAQGDFYKKTAVFLRKMHDRGAYFRDISAGNLLFRIKQGNEPEFALIDTGRAVFRNKSIGLRERLSDLMRICHPLFWKGRREFVGIYLALCGWRHLFWMNIPFYSYDLKHWLKGRIRRFRRNIASKTSAQPGHQD